MRLIVKTSLLLVISSHTSSYNIINRPIVTRQTLLQNAINDYPYISSREQLFDKNHILLPSYLSNYTFNDYQTDIGLPEGVVRTAQTEIKVLNNYQTLSNTTTIRISDIIKSSEYINANITERFDMIRDNIRTTVSTDDTIANDVSTDTEVILTEEVDKFRFVFDMNAFEEAMNKKYSMPAKQLLDDELNTTGSTLEFAPSLVSKLAKEARFAEETETHQIYRMEISPENFRALVSTRKKQTKALVDDYIDENESLLKSVSSEYMYSDTIYDVVGDTSDEASSLSGTDPYTIQSERDDAEDKEQLRSYIRKNDTLLTHIRRLEQDMVRTQRARSMNTTVSIQTSLYRVGKALIRLIQTALPTYSEAKQDFVSVLLIGSATITGLKLIDMLTDSIVTLTKRHIPTTITTNPRIQSYMVGCSMTLTLLSMIYNTLRGTQELMFIQYMWSLPGTIVVRALVALLIRLSIR